MNVEEIPAKLKETFDAARLGLADFRTQVLAKRVVLAIHDGGLQGAVVGAKGELIDVPLPPGTCRQGQPQEIEAIGDLIGDLLLELNLAGAKVSACLPLQACHWRVVSWPHGQMPESGSTELRLLAPDLGIPWTLSDVYLAVEPLPGTPARSLLVAAPRRLVDGWVEVFELAGVQFQRLLPAQVCEWQMLAPAGTRTADEDQERWFLELKRDYARLWLLAAGVPCADWTLPGQRRRDGLDPQLEEALLRCRRFWRQHRGDQPRGDQPQASWCLYGPEESITAAEADLQRLLGPLVPERWQPPQPGGLADLRLAGLKLCMGWQ
ncbi:MAG: hypothetical protein ACKO7Z_10435 [Cyanobacteriota bacterium]